MRYSLIALPSEQSLEEEPEPSPLPLAKAAQDFTTANHMDLAAGLSSLKVAYLPDFGEDHEMMEFTPREQLGIRNRWEDIAQCLLMPFAPKYSRFLSFVKDFHEERVQKVKKAHKSASIAYLRKVRFYDPTQPSMSILRPLPKEFHQQQQKIIKLEEAEEQLAELAKNTQKESSLHRKVRKLFERTQQQQKQ